ncbi:MAG: aminotransferase class IV [Actinomycetales bacterium]|nr:aminotransferase class IV [Actinomycetales bacterium]
MPDNDLARVWLGDDTGGRRVEPAEAHVSVFDHGFTVADGVFETIKVIDGVPFALSRHLRRLSSSAQALGMPVPESSLLHKAVGEVTSGSAGVGRLRITLTGGAGPMGSDRGDARRTLVLVHVPAPAWPATTQAVVVPWRRNEHSALAGVKSTSYAENVIALDWAKQRGASEALFANCAGHLCEGTGSNVFIVRDGVVSTPTLASGCLGGITRELVIEWCDVIEEDLPMEALASADEVFITSSTRDVHPVSQIDGRQLPAPGPVSADIQRLFVKKAAEHPDP